jgi:hypothetical protein
MPCPSGVNIPHCFSLYNDYYHARINRLISRGMYGIQLMGATGRTPAHAALCIRCGKCMEACPQHIMIPEELEQVSKTLVGFRTKLIFPLLRLMFRIKE